ncbi:MAG: HesA/MoeB/ThiF family protein [Elusimicrobia bacterium]|nr:HesA/MoeB/ThiF family protein [Elusimicrobiota bacterium]
MNNLRYLRQTIIPQFGKKGQKKISDSKICILGAGGIGSSALAYSAAAGIGNILIIENDILEETNLNRQIIYKERDLGKEKVYLAKKFAGELNSRINVSAEKIFAREKDLVKFFNSCDILIDCSDNFSTRFAVNSAAYKTGKPYIFSAVYRAEVQIALLNPKKGPCLRCFIKDMPNENLSCADYGVFGPAAGAAGCLAALKAMDFLSGISKEENILSIFDFSSYCCEKIKLKKRKDCPVCSGLETDANKDFSFLSKMRKIIFNFSEKNIHEKEAVNLRIEDLESAACHISKNAEILLFCDKGIRSKTAAKKLKKIGLKKIRFYKK